LTKTSAGQQIVTEFQFILYSHSQVSGIETGVQEQQEKCLFSLAQLWWV